MTDSSAPIKEIRNVKTETVRESRNVLGPLTEYNSYTVNSAMGDGGLKVSQGSEKLDHFLAKEGSCCKVVISELNKGLVKRAAHLVADSDCPVCLSEVNSLKKTGKKECKDGSGLTYWSLL